MGIITRFTEGLMKLLQTGAEAFISWMTGIVSIVLMLIVVMNTLIVFSSEDRVTKMTKLSAKDPLTCYLVLPFLSAFMLGNPALSTMARFPSKYYKPSYYATQAQLCHMSNGVSPHINLGGLFVWMGIAQGIETLGPNPMELAIRYLLVELLVNLIDGWVTDFTIGFICRQQGTVLGKRIELSVN